MGNSISIDMEDRLTVTIGDHVAVVMLTRPDKLNGLDRPAFRALNQAQDFVAGRPEVRAVVLAGQGTSFCAGLDFKGVSADGQPFGSLLVPHPGSIANLAQRAAFGWRELEIPVIAAIQGHCLGGGLQLALAADLRIASPNTKLSVMEIEWGLIPDMGISQTLPYLVGPDHAKELLWTGRVLGADEALGLGLVTAVAEDPLASAMNTATAIAQRSPDAIRAGKKLLNRAQHAPPAQVLALEESLQKSLIGTANQNTAVRAKLAGVTPDFDDHRSDG